VAILGAPLDIGTTFRPGFRFRPQGIRCASAHYGTDNYEMGIDIREQLRVADVGDVFVIPANIEKSFDQIARAVSHVVQNGVFPAILGGDHSIGYPDMRGIAPHIDGNVGIIHLGRHVDIQEKEMDKRMHPTPWFHATSIPNGPAEEPGAVRHRGLAGPEERRTGRPASARRRS
jgi:agmatinase